MATNKVIIPRSGKYKTWFDLSVLIIAHAMLFPLWLLLWTAIPILIRLGDPGPVFYKQERVGKGGRVFSVLKFRTMVLDAESKGPAWTTEGDPRVTRVGRLLRRTALDELPELFNILKREMSFVGPRALDVEEQRSLERLIPGFENRLQVLPGLTGLAQVYDPADDAQDKLRYDSEYLQRMSPWLDMKLLVLSVRNTLWIKWDRRSGKTSDANVTSDSPSKCGQQQGAASEGHIETNAKQ
jgi:lipopolysaccharide/colanic/teichoic acid biosynthesis glycosyltransferase